MPLAVTRMSGTTVVLDGEHLSAGVAVIYQDVVPTGDTRLMGGA